MSALLPLGVRWRALGHISLHMQARDGAGRRAGWQAEGEMCRIGLHTALNADREIKGDQQSTTHK